jgi:hypothetical protein
MNNILAVVVPVVTPVVVNRSRGGSGSSPFEDQLMESMFLWLGLPWIIVSLLGLLGLLITVLNDSLWSKVERIVVIGGIIMLSYTLGYTVFWIIKWLTYN